MLNSSFEMRALDWLWNRLDILQRFLLFFGVALIWLQCELTIPSFPVNPFQLNHKGKSEQALHVYDALFSMTVLIGDKSGCMCKHPSPL